MPAGQPGRAPAWPRRHCLFERGARPFPPASPARTPLPDHSLRLLSFSEYNKIVTKTALGFVVMGTIGFFVKLVFIVSEEEDKMEGSARERDTAARALEVAPPTCTHFSIPFPSPARTQPINQIIVGGGQAKE